MSKETLEIVYGMNKISPVIAINAIVKNLSKVSGKISYCGRKVELSDITDVVMKSNRKSFRIEVEDFVFDFSSVKAFEHILIVIEKTGENDISWWDEWVSVFFDLAPFTEAYLLDSEYSYWQNATDPLEYSAKGRSCEGLPMQSNGLPSPLDQVEIDISQNPGRRLVKKGYVEAVGAYMWFGEDFWKLVGKDRMHVIGSLLAGGWELNDEKFISVYSKNKFIATEKSKREQESLREILFGEK